jgi:two-component system cell cycle sensor histidine kinase/response regulator CckA
LVLGRILVVDDNALVRLAYAEVLTQRGYTVIEANDGEEALRIMPEGGFDVAIIDVRMPVMGGLELRQRLKSIAPQMGTILVSGHPEWAAELVADDPDFLSGRVVIFGKPVHPVTLLEEVDKRMRK